MEEEDEYVAFDKIRSDIRKFKENIEKEINSLLEQTYHHERTLKKIRNERE